MLAIPGALVVRKVADGFRVESFIGTVLSYYFKDLSDIFLKETMAGDAGGDQPKFTGLAKYFNSYTDFGRANTAKATYAAVALIAAYIYLKPKKKEEPKK